MDGINKKELPPKQEKMKVVLVPDHKNKSSMQIVATEDSKSRDNIVETRFLGKQDQVVDRQTIARRIDKFNEGGGGGKITKQASSKTLSQPKNSKVPKGLKLADLAQKHSDESEVTKALEATITGTGKNGRGLSSNNDYIEDVSLGDITLLNTKEYKFYGFYFRIRQQLEQYWGKTLREKADHIYKSGRRLPASEDRITSLTIYLDPKGNITEVLVKSPSGVKELDDAAVEAFNKAGPFPNPPKGMINGGKVKIEWGFVVKS